MVGSYWAADTVTMSVTSVLMVVGPLRGSDATTVATFGMLGRAFER